MRLRRAPKRTRQRNLARVTGCGQPLHRGSTGIAQTQHLGGLVEGFAQRVVDRRAQPAIPAHALDQQQLAVPARGEQQQIGEFERGIGQAGGQCVAFEMIDRQQRLVPGHGQGLGGDQPDQHPAEQSRSGGSRAGVDVAQRQPGIGQGRGDQRRDPFGVGARGDLGHDPAIGPVCLVLRGDALGQNRPIRRDQRRRGLVARRFYAEYEHHPGFP